MHKKENKMIKTHCKTKINQDKNTLHALPITCLNAM